MSDWLDSLAKLKREVPDDVLVLPAHNECFRGLHARIDALAAARRRRCAGCADRSPSRSGPSTSSARCSPARSANRRALLGMATGEAVACLNHLMQRGEATR